MTDNPLVEAVARSAYIRQSQWLAQNGLVSRPDWDSPDADPRYKASLGEDATAALRVIEDAGWKVVPVEPTEAMLEAGDNVEVGGISLSSPGDSYYIWGAMLEAAPAIS